MAERLSASMRDRLDALVAVGDGRSALASAPHQDSSASPSVGGMKRLLARLELIETTGVLEIDVGWVNGNYQRILFHTVRTASADRVREIAAPRRHLALVCFLHQAWRDTLDQALDMYGKLLDRNPQAGRGPPRRHAQGTDRGRPAGRPWSPPPPCRSSPSRRDAKTEGAHPFSIRFSRGRCETRGPGKSDLKACDPPRQTRTAIHKSLFRGS